VRLGWWGKCTLLFFFFLTSYIIHHTFTNTKMCKHTVSSTSATCTLSAHCQRVNEGHVPWYVNTGPRPYFVSSDPGDPSRCRNDACARARAHDKIEVINQRAQRRSNSELPVTSYLSIRMLVRITVAYSNISRRLSFRLHIHWANRTTCPVTLIVAWLVNLYIEYIVDIK
jgi:hypothetical protein